MHIGVIGAGGMGSRHVENLRSIGGVEVTVFDVDLDRASEVAGRLSSVADDPYRLIADSSIDGIVVASPDHTHADLTLACLLHGKQVLVEKPMAEATADAERVLMAEASAGRRLVQVGFMREFDPDHQALLAEVNKGTVGRPMLVRCSHANPGDGVPVGDALLRSAIHDLHTLRFLTQQEIREVMVHTIAADKENAPIQMAVIGCRLDSALGNITLNMASGYGYLVEVELVGERGVLRTEGTRDPRPFEVGVARSVREPWLDRFQTGYHREIRAWVDSLSSAQAVGPSAWDGYATVAAANACIESAAVGEPVQVDLISRWP
jgi:myo-inositol 2-dehydrogenase / D-chiro-inositol 1-dehydrogenase